MLGKIGDFAGQAVGALVNSDEMVISKLASASHVVIDQTPDWIEICGICEIENEYKIYSTGANYEVPFNTQPIGTFKESSGCCCRCFLKCAREFKGTLKIGEFPVSTLNAPFKCHNPLPICSCFCS